MSTSLASNNSLIGSFADHFKLESRDKIRDYFPDEKDSFSDELKTKLRRIAHFLTQGVWINEQQICLWAENHPEQQLSALLDGKAIKRKIIRHEQKMVVPKSSIFSRIKDSLKFLSEFIQHPTTVGAILPSSKSLAREIVREIPKDDDAAPRLILEVGPGTGIFTDKIIQRMNPKDELHLVEYDEQFCNRLKEKYKDINNVHVFHRSILEHSDPKMRQYDYVVSGLPLNAFEPDFVEQVFTKFTDITKEKGKISYFEYRGIPQIRSFFTNAKDRETIDTILALKKSFHEYHMKDSRTVYFNAPPARVLNHEIRRVPKLIKLAGRDKVNCR